MEFRAAGPGPEGSLIPLYLAYPDTLGSLSVRAFLQSPADTALSRLKGADWQARPLSTTEKRFLKALRDMVDGRLEDARNALAELASRRLPPPIRSCLRINAALLLYLAGLPQEAERDWLRVWKSADPAAEGAWRNLYSLYLGRADFSKAHGLVNAALQASPKNKWALLAKGYLLRMLSPDDDLEDFLKARSSWKDSMFGIQIAYGKFLKDKGQYEEAVKYYNRGLEGSPGNGQAWLELADAYYRLGYLVFSERCIRNAFRFGVQDPYVFELFARILRDYGQGTMDSAQAASIWAAAEKLLEEGFPHNLHSRSMAQLLYHLYCRNGKVEAAANLRAGFWFHFAGPAVPGQAPRLYPPARPPRLGLAMRLTEVTFPWVLLLNSTDFLDAGILLGAVAKKPSPRGGSRTF